jgi:hypothetical protein
MFLWGSCNIRTVHGLRQQFDSDIFSPFLKYYYSTVNFLIYVRLNYCSIKSNYDL